MHNMLIRPTEEELDNFGDPDFTIFNAGECKANTNVEGITSDTSIGINLKLNQMVILGTEYAGEMKKGVFRYASYGIVNCTCFILQSQISLQNQQVPLFSDILSRIYAL